MGAQNYTEFFLNSKINQYRNLHKQLNYIGTLPYADIKTVGIVGSRKMTEYGRHVCEFFCRELAAAGVTIVSGLMYGVDLCAHQVTLNSGGRTIAVLGYGLDHLAKIPYAQTIASNIVKKNAGIVISQFPKDQAPQKWTFIKRNHLIAALSDLLIVVEAGEKSGSLITVGHALEMGKDVFSVPGPIFSSQSKGTNSIIDLGANILLSTTQILDALKINPTLIKKKNKLLLDDLSQKLLDFIESKSYVDNHATSDEIILNYSYPPVHVYEALINLEILGLIEKDLAGRYTIRP